MLRAKQRQLSGDIADARQMTEDIDVAAFRTMGVM
jgi:hypothetical protein